MPPGRREGIEPSAKGIGRRQLLSLAAASLLVVTGCVTTRRNSELENYQEELRRLLDQTAGTEAERARLTSLARRIDIRSSDLVAEHKDFADSFNRLSGLRDVSDSDLIETIEDYSRRRKWLRDDLLRLQDELRAALSPDEWSGVVDILNRAGSTVARPPFAGA